ncbi:hypothetical protein [Schlesneria paludicola]|uniref:hypothetical protein n=1 Tax=Schlesneria paludicola TaxID=360056 RepID=UPI00030570FB|nr:hypothetical protein [Schlesneria paludicola]
MLVARGFQERYSFSAALKALECGRKPLLTSEHWPAGISELAVNPNGKGVVSMRDQE